MTPAEHWAFVISAYAVMGATFTALALYAFARLRTAARDAKALEDA